MHTFITLTSISSSNLGSFRRGDGSAGASRIMTRSWKTHGGPDGEHGEGAGGHRSADDGPADEGAVDGVGGEYRSSSSALCGDEEDEEEEQGPSAVMALMLVSTESSQPPRRFDTTIAPLLLLSPTCFLAIILRLLLALRRRSCALRLFYIVIK